MSVCKDDSHETTKSPEMEDHPDTDVVNIPVRELVKKVQRKEVKLTNPMIAQIRGRFGHVSPWFYGLTE